MAGNRCKLQRGARRSVLQVIDAETLLLDDRTKLLLVGAMAPHPPMPTGFDENWPPLQASKVALVKLVTGRSIELAYGDIRKDRHGRRLAQAYLLPAAMGDGPLPNISHNYFGKPGLWLQAWLVGNGLARAYALPQNENCLANLVAIERRAIAAKAGLWAHAAFQIRASHLTGELLRYYATYQVIEGRVLKLGRSKSRSYLNFGPDWRKDFTVGIDNKNIRAFAASGLKLKDLPGRYLRIRGWVEARNGPFIHATDPGQIELLER